MRSLAAVAALLAISLASTSQTFSQGASHASLEDAFRACVEIAKQRGWSLQDLGENRPALRKFVISCMQGHTPRTAKK
jgi:hypothetical protein